MAQSRLLIGSNDVGLQDIEVLRRLGASAASAELGYSGDQVKRIADENIEVRTVPLDALVAECESVTKAGIGRLDGVAVMSCRPYGSGAELDAICRKIRALPDSHLAFPAIPARNVPLVISDLKHALAGRAVPGIKPDMWTSVVPPEGSSSGKNLAAQLEALPERTMLAWLSACRRWRADLLEDLELGGLVVTRGRDGNVRPRLALRRKATGGRMHLPSFEPVKAYQAGLPIFLIDLDIEREPFCAFHELCTESFTRYARSDRSKGEIVLHRFLDTNPALLRSDTYKAYLTETGFSIRNGGRSGMRTDLILEPVNVSSSRLLIAELKRPDVAVYREEADGIRLTRKAMQAISQVLNYRRRLLDPVNDEEVKLRLKQPPPSDYDLAVIIGLRPEGELPETAAAVRALALGCGVHLIRFDELAQFGMKLIGKESVLV